MNNVIAIYNGPGTSKASFEHTQFNLQACGYNKIKTLSPSDIKQGDWKKQTDLLIMPGGADVPYHRSLRGNGCDQIKSFVEDGGRYLGLCAGAYFACATIDFKTLEGKPIQGSRELAFFTGTAVGPYLAAYDPNTNSGVCAAQITLNKPKPQSLHVFFNGGCYFDPIENQKNMNVLAYYQGIDKKPAILQLQVGLGSVVLSGVHPEYSPTLLNQNDPHLKNIIPTLEYSDAKRLNLMKIIFDEWLCLKKEAT